MKLISMTDFVLKQSERIMNCELTHLESHHQIVDYSNFLKQPLKLEMFVPCDENCNVLEEPEKYGWLQNVGSRNSYATEQECIDCETFHLAKEKVLFERFELVKTSGDYKSIKFNDLEVFWYNSTCNIGFNPWTRNEDYYNIEDLIEYDLTLTPNAIKRIFG